jgi:hypothetical protein
MEKFTLDNPIKVLCVTASSFPDGIMAAHNKLHALVPNAGNRRYFGISRPEKGQIIYKAAAEERNPGEGEQLNCESFVIAGGEYVSVTIIDFMKDVQAIGKAFQQLTSQPDIDPDGYCVEWYVNEKDVKCMVKLK